MEPTIYDITLELQRACAPWALTVKKGDTGRRLRLRLLSGGKAYPITDDCYAVFTAQKPDGTVIYNSCTREGDRFIYDLTPQTTAAAGVLPCELRLYGKDDALLTAAAFTVTVEDTVYTEGDEAVTSTGEATALTRLITQARDTIGEMEKLLTNEVNHAVIDDTKAGADAWSGKNIADKLCPSFTESGSVVVCNPVEGYPLGVVTRIEPVQSGSGDPSPDNIRPITGHTSVNLYHGDNTFTLDLGQTVYGGSLDWKTGVLTIDFAVKSMVDMLSSGGWLSMSANYCNMNFALVCDSIRKEKSVCSHLVYKQTTNESGVFWISSDGTGVRLIVDNLTTVDEYRAWITENNPTIVYPVTPTTVQLTPQEILALSGVNTLYSDTGDTIVTGKKDPVKVIENLTNAIIALGGNI